MTPAHRDHVVATNVGDDAAPQVTHGVLPPPSAHAPVSVVDRSHAWHGRTSNRQHGPVATNVAGCRALRLHRPLRVGRAPSRSRGRKTLSPRGRYAVPSALVDSPATASTSSCCPTYAAPLTSPSSVLVSPWTCADVSGTDVPTTPVEGRRTLSGGRRSWRATSSATRTLSNGSLTLAGSCSLCGSTRTRRKRQSASQRLWKPVDDRE